jgi:hypothetical protein
MLNARKQEGKEKPDCVAFKQPGSIPIFRDDDKGTDAGKQRKGMPGSRRVVSDDAPDAEG